GFGTPADHTESHYPQTEKTRITEGINNSSRVVTEEPRTTSKELHSSVRSTDFYVLLQQSRVKTLTPA
ncbi:hypothetical protein ATANTOWER_006607, partial [Ataeniobius toweri]|nr:hypothetical protein [Ataeniobius toweri]